jgi:uncharacterized protein with ParB-like and HNH nuclease domain
LKGFQEQLAGGHPNSLGNTVEVVDAVLAQNDLFAELFNCYFSDDEVVRLRTSNAMKRIGQRNKSLLVPYLDRFLTDIARLNQASAQWTLAQLFSLLENDLDSNQRRRAKELMKNNLANHTDWIVLNQTMATLSDWAESDAELKVWLKPHLQRLAADDRKSVSGRAQKFLKQFHT